MNAPTRKRPYKPESNETNAARQARLREQRKAKGWRRVSLWLSPEQVKRLNTLGGEFWLGARVKALLEPAMVEQEKQTANPLPDNDKAALWREADSLNNGGMPWEAIARRWNDEGRRTRKGAEFRGANIAREVKQWKASSVS